MKRLSVRPSVSRASQAVRCALLVGLRGLAVGITACTQVDVYAVTESSVPVGVPPAAGAPGISDETQLVDGAVSVQPAAHSGGTSATSPSVACPSPSLQAGDTSVTVQLAGVSRSYLLHVPVAYDGSSPVPLLVDFHGIGGTGRTELTASPYPAVTDPEGVIMAFPDGLPGPIGTAWNMGPCCVADVDDLAFARALVTDVQRVACIDSDRVYAVGVLTGGGMVYHLACHAADVFAAVAPAAFDLLQETVDDCVPSRPITIMSFRGTADSRVPYAGGASSVVPGMPITFLGATGTLQRWGELNKCTGALSAEDSNGCAFYSGCADGVDVALCTADGGGEDPGAADVAWPVLKRHVR